MLLSEITLKYAVIKHDKNASCVLAKYSDSFQLSDSTIVGKGFMFNVEYIHLKR
jgi:hypothetical protein